MHLFEREPESFAKFFHPCSYLTTPVYLLDFTLSNHLIGYEERAHPPPVWTMRVPRWLHTRLRLLPPRPPPPDHEYHMSQWQAAFVVRVRKRGRGESRYLMTLDYHYTGTLPCDIPIIPLPPYYGNFFRQNKTSCTQFLTAFPASGGFLVARCFGRRISNRCEKPSDFLICRCLRFCWNNLKILVSNRRLSECCQNVCALWYACKVVVRDRFPFFYNFYVISPSSEISRKTRQQLFKLHFTKIFLRSLK